MVNLRPRGRRVRRYLSIAQLLATHVRPRILQSGTAVDAEVDAPRLMREGEALAADLEAMGPTFVKLGQLLSTRQDLLAPPFAEALARLQDDVAAVDFAEIEAVIEAEFGRPLDAIFSSFDRQPLASASIAQVHRAELAGGRTVAVKVQRPGVKDRVMQDIGVLSHIAAFLEDHTDTGRRYGFADLFDQFRASLLDELDFRREAGNLQAMRELLIDHPRVRVPEPIDGLIAERVVVMDYVSGRKVSELPGSAGDTADDRKGLADELFGAYLEQVLVEGFFHADPHPGNVLITDDGDLALIDLGMVARITPETQDALVRLLLAVADGRSRAAAQVASGLGEKLDDFDEEVFRRAVASVVERTYRRSVSEFSAGSVVLELSAVAADASLRPLPELAMLGRALLNLDQVACALDPDFDPSAALRRHAGEILQSRLRSSPGSLSTMLIETRDLAEHLPGRINRVLHAAAEGDLQVKVRAFDETEFLMGLQKLANRVTSGLVLAALILGAAMLMRVQTSSRLLGYPTLAMVCFLGAVAGGVVLLGSIHMADRRVRRRVHRR